MILVACVTLLVMVSTNAVQGDPSCPKKDGEYPVYIPHEDCTKFWQCSNGRPYLFDCPANLHFNPKLNVCDWPESAGCTGISGGDDNSAEPTESSKSDETEDRKDSEERADSKGSDETEDPKEPEEPEDSKDSDDTEDSKKSDETENPKEPVESEEPKTSGEDLDGPSCPKKDGEYPVYIPHKDCTKFWQCSNGRPYLFDCPANLHFNPKLNVCDWPESAGCTGISGGDDDSAEPTESSKSDETEDSKDSEEAADPKASDETDDPKEPEEPEDSKDSDDTEDSKEPKDSEEPEDPKKSDETEDPKEPVESEEPKTSDEDGDGPSCPKKDGEYPVYIPHEDCTKFWQCSNGRPYLFDCPANLHFNPKLNVCDWPESAGCTGISGGDDNSAEPTESSKSDETEDRKDSEEHADSKGSDETEDPKEPEEPEDSKDSDDTEDSEEPEDPKKSDETEDPKEPVESEEPKTSDEDPDDPSCPKKDGEYPVYIPHEDCTKFWQCSNGRPYLFDCPANLHFNPKLNVCDWPENAGCKNDSKEFPEPVDSDEPEIPNEPEDPEQPEDPDTSNGSLESKEADTLNNV